MKMISLFWLRRDLRLKDNAGLYYALKSGKNVLPVFILDVNILEDLQGNIDARVEFILIALKELKEELKKMGSDLLVEIGRPCSVFEKIMKNYKIKKVYTNHDFEPYALNRDKKVASLLEKNGIAFETTKDHLIFEKDEILKSDGTPYTVFTPYSRRWKEKLLSKMSAKGQERQFEDSFYLKAYPTLKYSANFFKTITSPIPSLTDLGFAPSGIKFPSKIVSRKLIKNYSDNRDFPAREGTSKLGVHFRFGTISIREKARNAVKLSDTYLKELIWRDFYAMILAHFPKVVGNAFRSKYEAVPWRHDEEDYETWKQGKTGYPLVDAGMRELANTGYMHNRVRMVVASFFTKHLLMDWRLGEAWFAQKLLDYDLASNNGGWQWAAGCGTDAAPYFRIFNPTTQLKKFDPSLAYVKKWVPEFGTDGYPEPMIDHKFARERCLKAYKAALA